MSEFERWRGQVDARLDDSERRLSQFELTLSRNSDVMNQLIVALAELRATIKTWGTAGLLIVPVVTGVSVGVVLKLL